MEGSALVGCSERNNFLMVESSSGCGSIAWLEMLVQREVAPCWGATGQISIQGGQLAQVRDGKYPEGVSTLSSALPLTGITN